MDEAMLEGCEENVKLLLLEIIKNMEKKTGIVFVEEDDLDDCLLCSHTSKLLTYSIIIRSTQRPCCQRVFDSMPPKKTGSRKKRDKMRAAQVVWKRIRL